MQFYWAETVVFIKKWQLIFLYSGWIGLVLRGRAFDHHNRNGGQGICQQKLPAGPGIWLIFQMPGGMLAAGIDSHIIRSSQVSFSDLIYRSKSRKQLYECGNIKLNEQELNLTNWVTIKLVVRIAH